MSDFLPILLRLFPLYLLIVAGYWVGLRHLHVRDAFSAILIYMITPVVVFYGAYEMPISFENLFLPIILLTIGSLACVISYAVAGLRWQSQERNILAYAAGTGNTGYFGVPLSIILLGHDYVGMVVFANIGITIYEITVGTFVSARAHTSIKSSFLKIFKLPIIYAFALGLLCNTSGIQLDESLNEMKNLFLGSYSFLGMMLIGLGLAAIEHSDIDWYFIGFSFVTKFILWPVLVLSYIYLDSLYFGIVDRDVRRVLVLLSAVPLAANCVAFAGFFNLKPAKTSLAVGMSTMFALFFVPFYLSYMLKLF